MDTLEGASPAERQATMTMAVCWECGAERSCHEYIVCCTGTVFHVCPECEDRIDARDEPEAPKNHDCPAVNPP